MIQMMLDDSDLAKTLIGISKLCLLPRGTHLHDVRIRPTLMGLIVLSVFKQNFVHVGAGVLEQFISAVEDYEGDLTVAQNAQLVGLFH